jgi:hypothetical protein
MHVHLAIADLAIIVCYLAAILCVGFLSPSPQDREPEGLAAVRGGYLGVGEPNLVWFKQPWLSAAIVPALFTALNLIFF